jgi:rod shape-determining protein MreD
MNGVRGLVYLLLAWVSLTAIAAVDTVLPLHAWVPEIALLFVLHLGLQARGTAPANVGVALAMGYLLDLFSGSPRGLHALTLALVMVFALGASSRLMVASLWQQVVVAALTSLGHGALLVALSAPMYEGEALQALKVLPSTALATALAAPLVFALCRRVDRRLAPDPRTLRLAA